MMNEDQTNQTVDPTDSEAEPVRRKRPRPGERRVQILQTLARLLEQPSTQRITTALLAHEMQISEAALYRQFASKAQMFEGLIEYIESSVFRLINQICDRENDGLRQAQSILVTLLKFAEKNPGMVRVMTGDALVNEHERLNKRMQSCFERLEASMRQSYKLAAQTHSGIEPAIQATLSLNVFQGRLLNFVKSGFKRLPSESLDRCIARIS